MSRVRGIARQSKTTAGILLSRAAHPAKIRSPESIRGYTSLRLGALELHDPTFARITFEELGRGSSGKRKKFTDHVSLITVPAFRCY